MTVAISVQCSDGTLIACDSLATFTRGAPVAKYTKKVKTIEHPKLLHPVVLAGAGINAFCEKFVDRAKREAIEGASELLNRKLDIVDFTDHVCESLVPILFKEYYVDRNQFLGVPMFDFSLSMIVAGATRDGDIRSYVVHSPGLSERVEYWGTIGSGAAYAELFLRGVIDNPDELKLEDAHRLAVHIVKGVEIMDPNVGGEAGICILRMKGDQLIPDHNPKLDLPNDPKGKMEQLLREIGSSIKRVVKEPDARGSESGRKETSQNDGDNTQSATGGSERRPHDGVSPTGAENLRESVYAQ